MLDLETAIQHCEEVALQNDKDAITFKKCKESKTNLYEKLTSQKAENDCKQCICKWRYIDEALKLIGDENSDKNVED